MCADGATTAATAGIVKRRASASISASLEVLLLGVPMMNSRSRRCRSRAIERINGARLGNAAIVTVHDVWIVKPRGS